VPHGDFKYVGYTGVYNVVDYSAVSFPTGVVVDKTKDKPAANVKAQSEYCQEARDSCKFCYGTLMHCALSPVLIYSRRRGVTTWSSSQSTVSTLLAACVA
jgi:hypothetical protein